jgi:parallel beta-helix repeat protein
VNLGKNRSNKSIVLSLAIAELFAVALLWLLDATSPPARADPGTLFASTTGAGTACTQSDPCSLQTALAHGLDGDVIYVATGTYTGTGSNVIVIATSITVYGGWNGASSGPIVHGPATYPTTLDGQGQRRVVLIGGNISPTLDGFVITRGKASEGAGIGLYPYPSVDAAAIVRNNVITNNVATGGWGGGIQVDGGRPLIEHNRILSNSTPYQGGGIAIAWYSYPTLKDNLIAGNTAQVNGAGIRLRDTWTTLVNNTIADSTGAGSDGIHATNTTITLTNNVIATNDHGLRTDGTITPTITHNNVWSNTTANYSGLPDPTGGNGNISLDPLFVSGPEGGYYLSQVAAGQAANSPCVDAGSDTAAHLGLDNRTSRTDGTADGGAADTGYHYRAVEMIYLPLILK